MEGNFRRTFNRMNSEVPARVGVLKFLVVCACAAWSPGTTSGQPVYSVNALAYADVNLAAGFNLMANPFSASDNSVSNLFHGVPAGSFYLPWNASMGNYSPTNSFTQASGWADPGMKLVTPNGGFLWVPTATKLSFVGEVWQGLICAPYSAGLAVLSDLTGCAMVCDNVVGPCPGDISTDGTIVSKWNSQAQSFDAYQYLDGAGWIPGTPTLAPGESAEVSSPISFSVRTVLGSGAGPPRRALRATGWQRDNDTMTLRFATTNGFSYTMLRSVNIASGIWVVLKQDSASATGGMASIMVAAETNQTAFYRLIPAFSTTGAVLMNASRGSNQFRCEFYTPIAASYELERTVKLTNSISGAWQTIATVSAGPSNIVTFTDIGATAPSGYYRLRYNRNP